VQLLDTQVEIRDDKPIAPPLPSATRKMMEPAALQIDPLLELSASAGPRQQTRHIATMANDNLKLRLITWMWSDAVLKTGVGNREGRQHANLM
jgi:hypothetical protein